MNAQRCLEMLREIKDCEMCIRDSPNIEAAV